MACTFFGHRNVSNEIEPTLRATLIDLIEKHDVNVFYVGNNGGFDLMVRNTLKSLSAEYQITYYVVLAYMPQKREAYDTTDYSETILPDGIEKTPKRFAITYRNKWMIQHSDYVVTYVTHQIASGAAQFKDLAERKGKQIIELSELSQDR